MTDRPLTCQELVEIITEYLDGALPAEERARIERHLAVCPGCQVYLEQMRTTRQLLGTFSAEDIPTSAQEHLLAAFRGLQRRPDDF